jgi:excisionase family DNA binding protein
MVERWLSTKEFCQKYGYNRLTLYAWKKDGKIRWVMKGKRLFFLDPGLLENLTALVAPREIKVPDLIPILRQKEVAQILGISPRRVMQLIETGKLGYRMIGKTRRFTVNHLREIMAYREMRKEMNLKNGDRTVPRPTPADKRRVVIAWALQRLADSA